MKKAMISQPMKGKSTEEIKNERVAAEKYLNNLGYEAMDTVFELDVKPEEAPLMYMSKSIEAMSKCNLVYFMKGWEKARGCIVENQIAIAYGKEMVFEQTQ